MIHNAERAPRPLAGRAVPSRLAILGLILAGFVLGVGFMLGATWAGTAAPSFVLAWLTGSVGFFLGALWAGAPRGD